MASVGVLLGGGGARGLAHVGVLEGLEELGLTPVAVVGVSMGAIVGATYTQRADWSAALRAQRWDRLPVVSEAPDGDLIERLSAYGRRLRRLAPAVTHWSPSGGWSADARSVLTDLLGEQPRHADCRVPFVAVATDLRAGTRRVLDGDPLLDAVLASASIPGLAQPVALAGGYLIDGGFADPAPVDVVRTLGAERVVAVHVGLAAEEEAAENWSGALLQALEIGHRAFADARFRHADVLLRPTFSTSTRMLDFSSVADLIDAGRAAVDARRADLLALRDDEQAVHPGR